MQVPGTIIDNYHAELRRLATQCTFADQDEEIKRCLSKKVREKGFTASLDLTSLMQYASTLEMTEDCRKLLTADNSQANTIHLQSNPKSSLSQPTQGRPIPRALEMWSKWSHARDQSKHPTFHKT